MSFKCRGFLRADANLRSEERKLYQVAVDLDFAVSQWRLSLGNILRGSIAGCPNANIQTASSHFCRSYLPFLVLELSHTTVRSEPPYGLARPQRAYPKRLRAD